MEQIEELLQATFGEGVTVNIWNGSRLYVNLDSKQSFSYDLTQNFKISSPVMLSGTLFKKAKSIIPKLKDLVEAL